MIRVGTSYSHYKDPSHMYRVIDLAVNTEDSSAWVVYKALYGEGITFLRSINEWCEDVEKDGQVVKRFTPTGNENQ